MLLELIQLKVYSPWMIIIYSYVKEIHKSSNRFFKLVSKVFCTMHAFLLVSFIPFTHNWLLFLCPENLLYRWAFFRVSRPNDILNTSSINLVYTLSRIKRRAYQSPNHALLQKCYRSHCPCYKRLLLRICSTTLPVDFQRSKWWLISQLQWKPP